MGQSNFLLEGVLSPPGGLDPTTHLWDFDKPLLEEW